MEIGGWVGGWHYFVFIFKCHSIGCVNSPAFLKLKII